MVTASSNYQGILDLVFLERVLGNGNVTGGNDLILTDGDSIVGEDKTGPAGAARLLGGNSTGGGGNGGDVILTVGSPDGGGVAGIVDINGDVDMDSDLTLAGLLTQPTGVVWVEQAAKPHTNIGGEGQVWVRDDTPNVLMFTDDDNTDFVIGGVGGPSVQTFTTGALKGTYTAVAGEIVRVDGNLGGTISMPASPSDNDRVGVVDRYSGFPASYTWFVDDNGTFNGMQSPFNQSFSTFPISISDTDGINRVYIWKYSADEAAWLLESVVNFATVSPAPLIETRSSSFVSAGGNADVDVGASLYSQAFTTFDTVSVKIQGCVNTYVAPDGAVTAHWVNIEETWTVGTPNAVIRTILDDQTAVPGAEGHVSLGTTGTTLFVRVNEGASGTRTIATNVAVTVVACGGTVPA